jgi:hypothetical protein
MEDGYSYKRMNLLLWGFGAIGFLIYMIAYWQEFGVVVRLGTELIITWRIHQSLSLSEIRALEIVAYGMFGNLLFFNLALFCFSQFILPVRTIQQRLNMYVHTLMYVMGWHGAAVFVENGEIRSSEEELKKALPGVIFVEADNAVAIEKLWAKGAPKNSPNKKRNLHEVRFVDENATARIGWPGIVFTEKDERIADALTLGKQKRIVENVLATTRDGIEVTSTVTAVFTLGEEPEMWLVGRAPSGGYQVVVTVEKSIENESGTTFIQKLITGFKDDLSEAQKEDIRQFELEASQVIKSGKKSKRWKEKLKAVGENIAEKRVLSALYSKSNDPKNGEKKWSELPAKVAAEEFRTLISRQMFDELYLPQEETLFPLSGLKKQFNDRIASLGTRGYQLVTRVSLKGRLPEKGDITDNEKFINWPTRLFQRQEVLGERGIKIINASFGELAPVRPEVFEQRLAYWQARWQKQEMYTTANQDLQALRIRNQARAQTQQEMIYTLSQIFNSVPHSKEALAMRIYQALESAATAPIEKKLLPAETIQMLSDLRKWLMPEDEEKPDQDLASNRGVIEE